MIAIRFARNPSSYAYILQRVPTALHDLLPGIEPAGTSDLSAHGLKFSGNAQQRKRTYFLHHGSLLYNFAIDRVERYLRMPPRQPTYRLGRPHGEFNAAVEREILPARMDTAALMPYRSSCRLHNPVHGATSSFS